MAVEASVFALEDQGRLVEPAKLAAFLAEVDGTPVKIDACDLPIITSMHLQIQIAAKAHLLTQLAEIFILLTVARM